MWRIGTTCITMTRERIGFGQIEVFSTCGGPKYLDRLYRCTASKLWLEDMPLRSTLNQINKHDRLELSKMDK